MKVAEYMRKGREWIERNVLNPSLYHYGIKGMKWGVRKERPHSFRDGFIEEEIRSGRVSKTINKDKQIRHTKDGHTPGKSYIYGDVKYAQKLVDDLSGTGEAVMSRNGEWTRRERVKSRHIIGTHVDQDGASTLTNKAMIVYSRTGSHIYPRKEDQ